MKSFSLLEMLLAILLIGVVLATSANEPDSLAFAIFLLEIFVIFGLFATAVLGWIYRRGPARAFWAGFALFGIPLLFWFLFLGIFYARGDGFPLMNVFLLGIPLFAWIGGSVGRRFATPRSDAPAVEKPIFHPLENMD